MFVILLAIGLVLVPLAVFWTGTAVFGAYAEGGLGDFLSRLASDLTSGSRALWFLVFAPYLVWQCLRLSLWGVRRGKRLDPASGT